MGSNPDLSVCQCPDKLTGRRGQQEVEGERYEDAGLPQLSYLSANGLCDLTAVRINSTPLSHIAGVIMHFKRFCMSFQTMSDQQNSSDGIFFGNKEYAIALKC